ncbi:MAG TPA: DUF262 domain-containing HNH endonuclease family protein [Hyphomonadaceae bacterium]|jgi:hypothetical protein|nr:DUF262 domain-containing HNH endonuclease family protein [Hyphomonadaceae bacterium]
MPAVESTDLALGKVFADFYAVPDYQREYVWQEEQVEQLLSDIRQEQAEDPKAEYFIGSIVTVLNATGRYELIDGQQRMTTLFIALCALRDRQRALGEQGNAIQTLISTVRVDEQGAESNEARLVLQYEDAGGVVGDLVAGRLAASKGATRSVANMAAAHKTAMAFYEREFGPDAAKLQAFFGYLINRVKLIRVQTDGLARALKIFETINDRGVGLDSMDLLKNLLFRKSKPAVFESLKTAWKELIDRLFKAGEKPLRFLRYFVLATYGVEKLREDELYKWLVDNEEKLGFGRDPLGFTRRLNEAATAYINFQEGLGPDGRPHPDVEAIKLLAGKSTRQHLILLLAGRSLPADVFSALCRDAERILFVYLITRQVNREFEVLFPAWAVQLAGIDTLAKYEAFSKDTFVRRRSELADRFRREFSALDGQAVRGYQLRYILAKLTQAVDLAGYGQTAEGVRWLSAYFDGKALNIEHITPQTPCDEVRAEFGPGADEPANIWSIGNLALAEAAINKSMGNKPFGEKVADSYPKLQPLKANGFRESRFLLTRTISHQVEIGRNSAIDRAVARFTPFKAWNAAAIADRTGMLTALAQDVWDVHAPA